MYIYLLCVNTLEMFEIMQKIKQNFFYFIKNKRIKEYEFFQLLLKFYFEN